MNRSLAEGRQSFTRRIASIESGAECERLAPLISAAADGEADAEQLLVLKRHLRGCLSCRAALREARSVPAQVAALTPAAALADPGHVHAAWTWLHERLSSLALRGQGFFEMAATHKSVAVAASAAAIAGGGAATVQTIEKPHPRPHQAHVVAKPLPSVVKTRPVVRLRPKPVQRRKPRVRPAPAPRPVVRTAPAPAPVPAPQPAQAAPQPKPAAAAPAPATGEFAP